MWLFSDNVIYRTNLKTDSKVLEPYSEETVINDIVSICFSVDDFIVYQSLQSCIDAAWCGEKVLMDEFLLGWLAHYSFFGNGGYELCLVRCH